MVRTDLLVVGLTALGSHRAGPQLSLCQLSDMNPSHVISWSYQVPSSVFSKLLYVPPLWPADGNIAQH